MIQRPGRAGLCFRALALLMAEGIALTVVVLLKLFDAGFVEIPMTEIAQIFVAVSFAMLLGLVFAEIPSGAEHTFTRLGLATFCRTGLPLLVVIVIWKYSVCNSKIQPIFAAVVFYAVGHFGGMILSTLPLKTRPM